MTEIKAVSNQYYYQNKLYIVKYIYNILEKRTYDSVIKNY